MKNQKIAVIWVSLLILISLIVIIVKIAPRVESPSTLYVGGAGGGNYSEIQWAIDNASDGDTVFVFNGTYYENVIVNKTINLIGENKDTTILDGNGVDDVINIVVSFVNISGFTIQNSGNDMGGDAGIELYYVHNCIIFNNTITNVHYSIRIYHSSENIVTNNNLELDNEDAICLDHSDYNYIAANTIHSLYDRGIWLAFSDYNNITSNTITDCNSNGIFFYLSNENNIIGNYIFNNGCGIKIKSSSSNHIFHNNIKSNTNQAYDDTNNGNQWDNGYPSGGNYWWDYSGVDNVKGPNQDIPGSDGIGDTPYIIDSNSQDNYPLMGPYKPLENYIMLKQGWNLISIPLIQENQNLTRVLGSIDGWYDAVQWHDVTETNDLWKHHKVDKPFGNDLTEINETMGFWIHITPPGDTIFVYYGSQIMVNQTISIKPGWNLVGYPSLSNRNRTNALNNIDFGNDVDAIWTYNASTQTWKEITASDNFEVGRGYWIHSKVTKVWTVPL